jgi:hypothetical protein
LIAFSGVAKKFQHALHSTYVAGLLVGDLRRNLLWYTTDYRATRTGAGSGDGKPWRAPTWSWASLKGSISWDPDIEVPLPQVREKEWDWRFLDYVSHRVTSLGSDTTGELSDARLKVRGIQFCLHGDLRQNTDSGLEPALGSRARELFFVTNGKAYSAIAQFDDEASVEGITRLSHGRGMPSPIPALLVVSTLGPESGIGTNPNEQGFRFRDLLLHLFENKAGDSAYGRIGRFIIRHRYETGKEIFQYFIDRLNSEDRQEIELI